MLVMLGPSGTAASQEYPSQTAQDQKWRSDESEVLLFKMKSGLELYGELLSIRADSLVVAFDRGGWQYRDGVLSPMNVICHSDLRGVSLPGPRMTIMLALTGFLVGLIVSDVLVHNAEENRSDWFWWHHSLATTCVTITASTLLGAYIGSTMRAGSSSIFQNDEIDVRVLSQYARYKNGEPPYLKTLLPGK